ncbi:hypothetical protein EV188_103202 [Actinomycetospora succinea]|uniref:Uncharacterized protein n=1 Tax=Actinomycetospora succinea TaxID=663603 RepID=A0A4R6VEB8_9PSEU|nr:hypothetical protein [Actinomycetospora succinea]TDQ60701.1 hypothetical protein EV188_103202 [Actinomycetospora succinea]
MWTSRRFLALVVFAGTHFDAAAAIAFTRERLGMAEYEYREF